MSMYLSTNTATPLSRNMCRCLVRFRPGVSAVKVKIGQLDKTCESGIKMIG